jgi:hypothetical protein
MQLSKVEREEYRINMFKEHLLDSPLTATQSLLLEGLEDFQSSQRLNNNDDRKQAIQRINKIVHQTIHKY